MATIEAHGLRKVFGTTVALDNVDLRVEEGRILGAGVDVFDSEPAEEANPLLRSARAVLTPHSAFNTHEASAELMRLAVKNVVDYFTAGEPLTAANGCFSQAWTAWWAELGDYSITSYYRDAKGSTRKVAVVTFAVL